MCTENLRITKGECYSSSDERFSVKWYRTEGTELRYLMQNLGSWQVNSFFLSWYPCPEIETAWPEAEKRGLGSREEKVRGLVLDM